MADGSTAFQRMRVDIVSMMNADSPQETSALKENVIRSKALGFDGMGCIHPRQIKVIYDNYAPTDQEIENAKIIMVAFVEASQNGYGVVSVGTKMIDAPVVSRAQQTINRAISMGKLGADWISQHANGAVKP